jgi:hypothetical protein
LVFNNVKLPLAIKEFIGKMLASYIKIIYLYPNYLFRKLNQLIIRVLDFLNNRIQHKLSVLLVVEPLKLIDKQYDKVSKFTLFTFGNNKLLDHKYLFAALFSGLIAQEEFKKIGKKILIVSISNEDKTFHIHKNIIIDENTTVNNYLDKIKNSIQVFYEAGYPLTSFNILQIKL